MNKKKFPLKILVVLGLAVTLAFPGSPPFRPDVYAGPVDALSSATKRNGADVEKITIGTETELAEMFNGFATEAYPQNAIYSLSEDLDMTEYPVFKPMGDDVMKKFSGIFDGAGHSIKNLKIASTGGAGMFYKLDTEGIVENLFLDGVNISGGSDRTGAVAASNNGTIKAVHVEGTVTGKTWTGMIAGYNDTNGKINNCEVFGSLYGSSTIGGISGYNANIIERCFADVTISSSVSGYSGGDNVGGITGENTRMVRDCYSTGSIYAQSKNAGGITGRMQAYGGIDVINCYSTMSVSCDGDYVGGICGRGDSYTNITNCLSLNSLLKGSNYVEYINGKESASSSTTITNSYGLADTVITRKSGTAKNRAKISENELSDFAAFSAKMKWDFNNVWNWNQGAYPTLKNMPVRFVPVIEPVSVTIDAPALINLKKNSVYRLKAVLAPSNATVNALTWKSSNELIASVNETGLVTALKTGSVIISVKTANGLTSSVTIKVTN